MDRFALNGQRLQNINQTGSSIYFSQGDIYKTYVETYQKVVSEGLSGSGPLRFVVHSKDGSVSKYGYTADSRVMVGNNNDVLTWLLSEVVDRNGNKMEYHYTYDAIYNNVRLDYIEYGANINNGTSHYARIQYNYGVRTDIQSGFVAGDEFVSPYLITSLTIEVNNQTHSEYYFQYALEELSKLVSIEYSSFNGTKLNKTLINYNTKPAMFNSTTAGQTVAGNNLTGKLYPLDVNGDGFTDFVSETYTEVSLGSCVFQLNTIWPKEHKYLVKLYVNNKNNTYNEYIVKNTFTSQIKTGCCNQSQKFLKIGTGDFDGNGMSDFMIQFVSKEVNSDYNDCSGASQSVTPSADFKCEFYSFDGIAVNSTCSFDITYDSYDSWSNSSSRLFPDVFLGDLNGDGKTDVLWDHKFDNAANLKWALALGPINSASINNAKLPTSNILLPKQDSMLLADFTGDGKLDVLNFSKVGTKSYTIFSLETDLYDAPSMNAVGSGTLPNDYNLADVGDFNGDGKADLLFGKVQINVSNGSVTGTTHDWRVALYDGIDFQLGTTNHDFKLCEWGGDVRDHYFVVDVNGDGFSDVIELVGGTYGVTDVNWPYNTINFSKPYQKKVHIYNPILDVFTDYTIPISGNVNEYKYYALGDLNADGRVDLLNTANSVQIEFYKNDNSFKVNSISDGYGKKLNFNYECLTSSSRYSLSSNSYNYPFVQITPPTYVVAEIEQDNGLGSMGVINYTYKGLVYQHLMGAIGFEKVSANNALLGVSTIETRAKVETASSLVVAWLPVKIETKVGDDLINEVENTYYIELTSALSTYGGSFYYSGLRYFLKKSIEKDYLKGTSKTFELIGNETTPGVDSWGNITKSIVNYYNSVNPTLSLIQTNTTETPTYLMKGAWCLNVPNNTITIQKRGNKPAYIRTLNYTYNASTGNVTNKILDAGNTRETFEAYTYDDWGNVLTTTFGGNGVSSRTSTVEYTPDGRFLKKKMNTLGWGSEFVFHPILDVLLQETDVNGLNTFYDYDGVGNLIETELPGGNVETIAINWWGNNDPNYTRYSVHTSMTSGENAKVYYDVLGREIRSEKNGLPGTTIVNSTFNIKGQLIEVTEPHFIYNTNPNKTSYTYDVYGRSKEVVLPTHTLRTTYNLKEETVKNLTSGQEKTIVEDVTGLTTKVIDGGGSLTYEYYSSGNLEKVFTLSGVVSMKYDIHGNRTELNDPDAGVQLSVYNVFGEKTSSIDAKSQTFSYTYDNLGRVIIETNPDETIEYFYYKDKLDACMSSSGVNYLYSYNSLGQLAYEVQEIQGEVFDLTYTYDLYQRLHKKVYPNGLVVENVYDEWGNLRAVNTDGIYTKENLWSFENMDAKGRMTSFFLGNGISTELGYDQQGYGFLNSLNVSDVMRYNYSWNESTGNLESREESIRGLHEDFTYNNDLDCLIGSEVWGQPYIQIDYEGSNNGNIQYKSDAGDYVYSQQKPHAIEHLYGAVTPPNEPLQEIQYNAYNKLSIINEGDDELYLLYGPEKQRKKADYFNQGQILKTKYYINQSYEEVRENGTVKQYSYIFANSNPVAVIISDPNSGSSEIRYMHSDYLGSILALTDENGNVTDEQNFDAWGRKRDINNWETPPSISQPMTFALDRGYTFHEHLDVFGLINMNGRVYDPMLGRFLSPDPYVQAPFNTQNFNRYSYVLNNPLKYTDPSGEIFWAPILIGAFMNTAIQGFSGNINSTGDFFMAMGIGAASGAVGAWAGGALSGVFGAGTTLGGTVANGAVSGAVAGFAGGFVGGAGNAWVGGANFGQGLGVGLKAGIYGAAGGTLIGGITGGIKFQKQMGVFRKGLDNLGVEANEAVSATDDFLNQAQQAWYPDAPMDNVNKFTVENVPQNHLNSMTNKGAAAKTVPLSVNKIFTGNSNVYFHSTNSFSSAKRLFFTMGHEFVHVSQFASLAGQSTSIVTPELLDIMEYHAYRFEYTRLGSSNYGGYTPADARRLATQYSNYMNSLNYNNFSWTNNFNFYYPF